MGNPAKVALTKQTAIEFYKYECQPRDEWPSWLQVFSELGRHHRGRIATATYDTPNGEPVWWRWFDEDRFHQQFEPQS